MTFIWICKKILNIIRAFTGTFGQFNASLLNKSFNFFKRKSYRPQTFDFFFIYFKLLFVIYIYNKGYLDFILDYIDFM